MTDTTLTSTVGFTTNAAAISLAWDRIVNENLLPNFESLQLTDLKFEKIFRIVFKFDECLEDLSAGYLIQLILNESADGVLGPPCSACKHFVLESCLFSCARRWNYREILRLSSDSLGPAILVRSLPAGCLSDCQLDLISNFTVCKIFSV